MEHELIGLNKFGDFVIKASNDIMSIMGEEAGLDVGRDVQKMSQFVSKANRISLRKFSEAHSARLKCLSELREEEVSHQETREVVAYLRKELDRVVELPHEQEKSWPSPPQFSDRSRSGSASTSTRSPSAKSYLGKRTNVDAESQNIHTTLDNKIDTIKDDVINTPRSTSAIECGQGSIDLDVDVLSPDSDIDAVEISEASRNEECMV